jgi:hypothetical protein
METVDPNITPVPDTPKGDARVFEVTIVAEYENGDILYEAPRSKSR